MLVVVKKIKGSKYLQLKQEFDGLTGFEILSILQNELHSIEVDNFPQPEPEPEPEPELMVVPKTDTLTRARCRAPVYDPVSLESESDYFLTPKQAAREDISTSAPLPDPEEHYDVINDYDDQPYYEEMPGDHSKADTRTSVLDCQALGTIVEPSSFVANMLGPILTALFLLKEEFVPSWLRKSHLWSFLMRSSALDRHNTYILAAYSKLKRTLG